jgi:translation initiation factor 5
MFVLSDLLKYFSYELACGASNNGGIYKVNGQHSRERLQHLVDKFVANYILCDCCGNPETELFYKTKGEQRHLYNMCKACGGYSKFKSTEKIVNYMLKHVCM